MRASRVRSSTCLSQRRQIHPDRHRTRPHRMIAAQAQCR